MHDSSAWIPGIALRFKESGGGDIWMISRVNGKNVTLSSLDGNLSRSYRDETLNELMESGSICFVVDEGRESYIAFNELHESDRQEVCRRYRYIQAYEQFGAGSRSKAGLEKVISKTACKIGDDRPPAWNTLNGWIKRYIGSGGKLNGLFPRHYKKGCRKDRIDPRVCKIIEDCKSIYLRNGQIRVSSIHKMVEGKIIGHNLSNPDDLLKVPSYSTVKYRIEKINHEETVKGRVGKNKARYEFSGKDVAPTTSRILERVEADHTPLDINVLSDETGTLLGRPTLTVLIDHYSRMVTGYQISFEEPSYASSALAISNAILPKQELLDYYGVEGEWPAHGVMESMVADNGAEFWSGNLDMAVGEIGSVLQFAPVRSPNYKGVVERFFGTVKTSLVDSLPGKTNGVGRGSDEYIAQNDAKLTLGEFKEIFIKWLVNVYHRQPGKGSDYSPLDKWVSSEKSFPIIEESRKDVETKFMCTEMRILRREGVQLESLEYGCDNLRSIYRRDGGVRLVVKYSPFDMGYIYIFDSVNGVYMKVPCKNYRYAKGLSLYAHKVIRDKAKSKRKSYQDDAVLQRAKAELFGNIEKLHDRNSRVKRQVTSKRAARIQSLGVDGNRWDQVSGEDDVIVKSRDFEIESDDWEVW